MTGWPNSGLPDDHDPHVAQWLRQLIRPDDVFYDLGANRGIFSRLARELGATVVAFEPVPSTCALLGEVLGDDPKHIIVNAAVWDDYLPLQVTLEQESGRCEVGEHLHWKADEDRARGLYVAKLYTMGVALDYFIPDSQSPYPTIIKSDTQGSEVRWLHGAQESLGQCRAMILECYDPMLRQNGDTVTDMLELLERLGFQVAEKQGNDLLIVRS